jgi:UDP-3-O-[3-hydroxymyristoyl] glucosamine N-acyltransferase
MPMLLSEFFQGNELVRDAQVRLTHYTYSPFQGTVCFVLEDLYLASANSNENVTAVITSADYSQQVHTAKGLIVCQNPKKAFYELHNYLFVKGFMRLHNEHSIDASARIAPTAIIGKHVVVHPNVQIDHYAIIEDYSVIGENTYIGPNVVIGAKGLRNTMIEGNVMQVEDAGGVRIGKNCEILANAIVQKSFNCEYTSIGENTKVSVKASIGHGCQVGSHTMISGNAQIAGNVQIGNHVWIGPSVVIAEKLKIGDHAEVKLGSIVIKHVKAKEAVSGNFAMNHQKHLTNFVKSQR